MAKKRRLSKKARAAALRNLAKARRARGGGKRRRRVRVKSPRRRRVRTMARKRRSGGRRRGSYLTPKNIAVGLPAALGLIQSVKTIGEQAKYYGGLNKIKWNQQAGGSATLLVFKPGAGIRGTEAAKALGPVLEGGGISIAANKVVGVVMKPMPAPVKKLANARLVRV